jgi:hypothetical protein
VKYGNLTMDEIVRLAASHPDENLTLRWNGLEATIGMRQHVRTAFDIARTHGADVEVYEQRGWLTSTFTVRLDGTGRQLLLAVCQLAVLEEASR